MAIEVTFVPKDKEPVPVRPHLDTVLVDLMGFVPGQAIAIELVWRASIPAPRYVEQAKVTIREVKWGSRGGRTMNTLAVVVGVGARTSVGLTARHTAFLLRAGHAGFNEAPSST